MNFLEFIDRLIREPPAIVVLIIISILTAHIFNHVRIPHDHSHGRLIDRLEHILTAVLVVLTIEAFYSQEISAHTETAIVPVSKNPFIMLHYLIVVTFVSACFASGMNIVEEKLNTIKKPSMGRRRRNRLKK